MSDWLHDLPLTWMAFAVFGVTYLTCGSSFLRQRLMVLVIAGVLASGALAEVTTSSNARASGGATNQACTTKHVSSSPNRSNHSRRCTVAAIFAQTR